MGRGVYPTFSGVMSMGFGAPHQTAFTAYFLNRYAFSSPTNTNLFLAYLTRLTQFLSEQGHGGSLANVLRANYWQIVISALYFAMNTLLTCMLLGREWANYATKRKPLPVSYPRGIQRSSYFISMPFQYGTPLIASRTTIHWLVSRPIFLLSTTTVYSNAI